MKKASGQEGKGHSRARPAAAAKLARPRAAAAAVKAETPGQPVPELQLHQADPGAAPSDRTESKRAERRLAGIIASAMDAIITIDERHEITLVNPAVEQMFGYSEVELLGKPISMLIPERYREAHDAHIRYFAQTKVTNRGMGRFRRIVGRRADGREFPVDASIAQMERAGERLFSVILPDIARREDAETVAKKIIASLATPFQLGSQKQSVDIGTSIGIALYPADARDADALVKAADAAMYSAKQAGNSFHFCAA